MTAENYKKRMCGLLIGYYRDVLLKKTNSPTYRQRSIISYKSDLILSNCELCDKKCKDRKAICSTRTINDIENGVPVKNDCYYIDLAYKLGHTYPESRKLETSLPEFQKELIHAMDRNDGRMLTSLYERMSREAHRQVNVLYYDEMYQMMLMILDLLISGHYPDDQLIDVLTFMHPYLEENDQQLASYLIYRYYAEYVLDPQKARPYLKALKGQTLATRLLKQYHSLTPYSMIVTLLNMQKNAIQFSGHLTEYYKALAYIDLRQWKKSLTCIEKCFDGPLTAKMAYHLYDMMGIIAYQSDDFETAAFFFKHIFKQMPDELGFDTIYLMDSLAKTDSDLLAHPGISEALEKVDLPLTHKLLTYYMLKYEKKASWIVLEKYILEELKPLFKNANRYYQLILNDLMTCCMHTQHYQSLFTFLLIIP